MSHPARGAWIEICCIEKLNLSLVSHPARGAWIEMHWMTLPEPPEAVAPRKGCVD